jgi:gamma-glutamylcyclotransferase (GGCT)/AIG2-like uncharacterized protein YtfP
MSSTTLFVYGTLRPGFPNPLARRLKTQAKFVGLGSVPGALYDCGWYPGAVFDPDSRTRVVGEVFTVKHADRLLAQLDHYEGTAEPSNPFRRIAVKVRLDRGGSLEAWSYEMTAFPPRCRLIDSGDFLAHLKSANPRPLRS